MIAMGSALTTALVEFLWQGAAIAAALWIGLALLRRPLARYVAATAAMLLLALAPVVTIWRIYAQPVGMSLVFPGVATRVAQIAASTAVPGLPSRNWVLDVWALGVLAFSIRLIRSAGQVHRLRRAGTAADSPIASAAAGLAERMGVKRAVRVLVSTLAEVPSIVGWLRPAILLPASVLAGLTPEQLEAVLAHELAHVRRHDYVINLLQVVVETLLFYHPAVWWVSTQMRKERELCCDDIVVATCGDALGYARTLTTLERLRGGVPALALGSTGGVLSFRVKRLVAQESGSRTAPPRFAAVAAAALAVACFALSTNWTRVKAQSDALTVPALGTGVDVNSNGAALIHRTPVAYPEALQEKKIGGVVTVEATLDERGLVSDARVVSGPPELRKAALASVLDWHFMPAGVGAVRDVTITFQPAAPHPAGTFLAEQISEAEKELARVQAEAGFARTSGELEMAAANLAQLQEKMAASRRNQNEMVRRFVQDQVSEAEQQLARVKAESESVRRDAELVQAQVKLGELREKLDVTETREPLIANVRVAGQGNKAFFFRSFEQSRKSALARKNEPNPDHPSVIYRIEAGGLSDQVTKELLARLPAHAGDLLTPERLDAIRQAAHQFDEHFYVAVEPIPAQGDNVVLVRIDLRE